MKATDLKALAADFASWGAKRVRRIVAMTKRHGVICSSTVYSNGKAG